MESNVSYGADSWNRCSEDARIGSGMPGPEMGTPRVVYPELALSGRGTEDAYPGDGQTQDRSFGGRRRTSPASTTFADFVEVSFIPEFVVNKRYAGRSHFQAILKHVLPPERVAQAFGAPPAKARNTLTAILDWPYIDGLPLPEITPDVIHKLTAAALARGYSIQTATHIRNVIRSIFAHAIRTGFYQGKNPACLVALPPMARRQVKTLTLGQLKALLQSMHYPEREAALFVVLTDMNIAEICGLQWKHVNASRISQMIGQEFMPARSIAVRNQSYRGELSSVAGKRRRFTRVPELLSSVLHELKSKSRFTLPQDYVLVSRNGAPIRPENILARRLKPIGRSFDLPWLTWSVFDQTAIELRSQMGRAFDEELKHSAFHAEHPRGSKSSLETEPTL